MAEPLDLDVAKRRIDAASTPPWLVRKDAVALIAEVERLRGEIEDLRIENQALRDPVRVTLKRYWGGAPEGPA